MERIREEKSYLWQDVKPLNYLSFMKNLGVLAAFIGGAIAGAALGILFAPEKGDETRHRIADLLRSKGIKLGKGEMEKLVDEIASEIKGEEA